MDTVELVRGLEGAGSTLCILDNHECNAMAWNTEDPAHPGEFLRPHGRPGNQEQHKLFLDEVEGTPKHAEMLAWLRTLPLWLDLGAVRFVHACWHEASMVVLRLLLGPNNTLTDEVILFGCRKGPAVALPPGITFSDKGGKVRHEVRMRWWQEDLSTYRKAAIGPAGVINRISDVPLPAKWKAHQYSGVPVLFGHYWFTPTREMISPHFACLDYSVTHSVCRRDAATDEVRKVSRSRAPDSPCRARAGSPNSPAIGEFSVGGVSMGWGDGIVVG